jgi:hypothetical protein
MDQREGGNKAQYPMNIVYVYRLQGGNEQSYMQGHHNKPGHQDLIGHRFPSLGDQDQ